MSLELLKHMYVILVNERTFAIISGAGYSESGKSIAVLNEYIKQVEAALWK